MKTNKKVCFAAGLLGVALAMPALGANMIINNVDAPGVGFNDPTPAAPVGGNLGTTVGQQRLIAYQRALELWGKTLRSSVTIVVQGSFAGLSCTAGGGVLAQAGAVQIFANFPGAPLQNHWFGAALANALAGQDLAEGPPDTGPSDLDGFDDIIANFNGNVGKPDCIAGPGWYYGLDNNAGPGQIDFLDTFMHEVAHGLGFQNFATEATGSTPLGLPDVYMANTLDLTNGRLWNTFSAAEIRASAVRTGQVVWAGPEVTANAPLVLGPSEGIRLTGGVTKEIEFGTASFGPLPNATNFNGPIVVASDGVAAPGGGTTGDGCEPITSNVAGKIALVDRGLCAFVVKVKNAQNAGATGVIVANTLGRPAFGMAGADPTITIPSIGISNADGDAIKAAPTPVNVEYFIDPSRLAGTAQGYVRLYAPGVVEPGSSISHFDTVASPSLLMEPFITLELQSSRNLDLTPSLMKDVGWGFETLKIGVCDTGVPSVLRTGQMLHANVDACAAGAKNHGQFVSCMNEVTNDAKERGLLSGAQHGAISSCTARGRP
jgi:hypothetical protein